MNLLLQALYSLKIRTILNIGLVLCLSVSTIKAQMITTYAGNGTYANTSVGPISPSTSFLFMDALEFDPSGNLYVCSSENRIFKINSSGVISLFAGNGGFAPSGDGGLATSASIGRVTRIAFDATGNAYIAAATTHCIRKINTSGIITTIAGNGVGGFSGDGGQATAALTAFPSGLALDASGNIYFAEGYTTCGGCSGGIGSAITRVRKISASTGIITTIAGNGISGNAGDGGQATSANIDCYAIAIDGNNNLYLNNWSTIRKVNLTTGIISTFAGTGTSGYSGDGGSALSAQLGYGIMDLKVDALNNLYLNDWSSIAVVRKINLTSGIITTVAGTGTPGFSGDGGDPVYAQMNYPHAMAISSSGNDIYISDEQNYRLRKVDLLATPICPNTLSISKNRGANGMATITPAISPLVGTPSYYGSITGNSQTNPLSASYVTATSFTQTFPGNGIYNINVTYYDSTLLLCTRSLTDTILINNSLTNKSFNRRFNVSTTYLCNSGNVNFADSTSFYYSLSNPSATYTIVTNWGNGSMVTNTVNATNQILFTSASTSYTNPGVYTIQSIIKGAGIANDTVIKFVYVDVCGNVSGTVYNDINMDCAQNLFSGEFGIQNVPVSITSATNSYMAWANSGGAYSLNNVPAGTYTISVNGGITGYTTTCPASMPHLTTVTATTTVYNDFAMNCSGGFDVAATGISLWHGLYPGQTDMILPHVGVLNGSCNFVVAGQVKMILTPCIQYVPGGMYTHAPDAVIPAVTGDTLVWNVSDINNIGNFSYWNYGVAVSTCTNAIVGDSACITIIVLPTNGDVNPADNMFTRCFTIGVAYDPNYKEVTPKGYGVQGYIPATTNDLTYTLHFQNTGTANATNIYLLDTISNNLNINSIEIISSSHSVQPYLLPNRTMKFMFAYINLPDSTHDEEHSHGYITYRIKPNTGLAQGTQIKNTGYIYFDYNSPVVTNTTLNTIEFVTSMNKALTSNSCVVFPNPAKDKITVRLFAAAAGSITLYDVLGNVVKETTTDQLQSDINTEDLTSGVYFVKVTQQGKSFTQKIVIQK